MANNMSSRQACHAARYVVARVLRGLFWCLKYTVILPLATMALMTLFVLWKDNTTPGKLLVKEINFVRQTGHCCKVSDEAAFCLIQRPYISKTLLTRRISPRGSP